MDDVVKGFRLVGRVTSEMRVDFGASFVTLDDVLFFSYMPSGEKMRPVIFGPLRVRSARGLCLNDGLGIASNDYVFVATAIGEDAFRTGRFA